MGRKVAKWCICNNWRGGGANKQSFLTTGHQYKAHAS